MLDDFKTDARNRMQKCIVSFQGDLKKLRTGRAHPSLIEHIKVDFYGTDSPLNQVANISVEDARPTDEKHRLYETYVLARHSSESPGDDAMDGSRDEFESFLYTSCVNTQDLVFRDATGRLLCVSVVDREPRSLSAVYCYFDPEASSKRSLGVFNILSLVAEARRLGLDNVYLGYWLGDSRKMSYKAAFRPSEVWSPVVGFAPVP